jgi:ADP-heptose:LPS heptosyltransferase
MAFLFSRLSDTGYEVISRLLAPRRSAPRKPQDVRESPRILCFTRSGVSEMVFTLPLLNALRRHFGKAHITVACESPGAALADACKAVDEIVILEGGWNFWHAALKNNAKLQDYDWVIAATPKFDHHLAVLCRLTQAAIRVGFERKAATSSYYTDPVVLPPPPAEEHQVETLLRLLRPLGLVRPTDHTVDLGLHVPDSAREFAGHALSDAPFSAGRILLMNLSGTAPVKFREEDFIALSTRVLGSTDMVIGLVASPLDQQKAQEIATCMGSRRIGAIDTSDVLDLVALFEHASLVITPEGGGANLAAAAGRPAIVLWSDRPFRQWSSRSKKHLFIHAEPGEKIIPVERVWQALQPFLTPQQDDLEKKWADLLELPPSSGFDS